MAEPRAELERLLGVEVAEFRRDRAEPETEPTLEVMDGGYGEDLAPSAVFPLARIPAPFSEYLHIWNGQDVALIRGRGIEVRPPHAGNGPDPRPPQLPLDGVFAFMPESSGACPT